jgi:hypothetical protein
VSNNASKLTYRFDTASGAWSKAGDWVLPFTNLAEYNLWFGISQTAASALPPSPPTPSRRRRWR